jgi:hypothetical protein
MPLLPAVGVISGPPQAVPNFKAMESHCYVTGPARRRPGHQVPSLKALESRCYAI